MYSNTVPHDANTCSECDASHISTKSAEYVEFDPVATDFVKIVVLEAGNEKGHGAKKISFISHKAVDLRVAGTDTGTCSLVMAKDTCDITTSQAAMDVFDVAAVGGAVPLTTEYGWRCNPKMDFDHSKVTKEKVITRDWHTRYDFTLDPAGMGQVRHIGTYRDPKSLAAQSTCPDGMPNTWEIKVPNGVYAVTIGHSSGGSHQHWIGYEGCTYENVRTDGSGMSQSVKRSFNTGVQGLRTTEALTVEVLDGAFTLSQDPKRGKCENVGFIKLDLVATEAFPKPWLPTPKHEWWQMEVDTELLPGTSAAAAPAIGLVTIDLPHHSSVTFDTYGRSGEIGKTERTTGADCRAWWLFGPAKCYKMMLIGWKRGTHPDLAVYPDFPGYSNAFASAHFDALDTNGDGSLTIEEFKAETRALALAGGLVNHKL